MKIIFSLTREIINFIKNFYGVVQKPHATYLKLAKKSEWEQFLLIWILILCVLLWATAVKIGVFRNPMFFTLNFIWFFTLVLFSFGIIAGFLWLLGCINRLSKLSNLSCLRRIINLWAFSYLPTTIWFFGVSFLFVLFPPPRSFSFNGYMLSTVLIGFSAIMFFWKLVLYYLTLRIGFKTTWKPIIKISLVFFPILFIYSYILYKLGVFRVPFI